jgi:hypothetical protein
MFICDDLYVIWFFLSPSLKVLFRTPCSKFIIYRFRLFTPSRRLSGKLPRKAKKLLGLIWEALYSPMLSPDNPVVRWTVR